MSDVLIPFALDTNDRMVEVFEVPRGRDCECRCPSCRQGVIARKGEKTIWHFAHDPNAKSKPSEICELSFFSCCRLYLIQQALAGKLARLTLPTLSLVEQIGTYQRIYKEGIVTQSRTIQVQEYHTDGNFDLTTQLGSYTLALHVHYPGRIPPEVPIQESTGVLKIDITPLEATFQRRTGRPNRILPILQAMLEAFSDWPESISWLHHPRTEKVRGLLRESLRQEYDPTNDKPRHSFKARQEEITANSSTPEQENEITRHTHGPAGVFQCLKCQGCWEGCKFLHATCKSCQTHLYSRFKQKA